MPDKCDQIGFSFGLQWVLFTTVGWGLGFSVRYVGDGTVLMLLIRNLPVPLIDIVLGAGLGAGVGLMQWIVLRRKISRAGRWVLVSLLGWALAEGGRGMLTDAGRYTTGLGSLIVLAGMILFVVFGGVVIGVPQWLVLRRHVLRAGWWIVACALGWILGGTVPAVLWVGVLALGGPIAFDAASLATMIASGIVFGVITGEALARLVRHPAPAA